MRVLLYALAGWLDESEEHSMAKRPERLSPDRQITMQDIDCLKEAFKLFDCDRDGEITVEELGKVCISCLESLHIIY